MKLTLCAIAMAIAGATTMAAAQAWSSQKNVEIVTGAVNAVTHVNNGAVRVIGVAAPERLGGPLAATPTWKEQGADFVYGNWRAIFGPKGLTSAQVAFWEEALRKMAQAPEWKGDLEKNYWSDNFAGSAQLADELEKDYAYLKAILLDLGLAR